MAKQKPFKPVIVPHILNKVSPDTISFAQLRVANWLRKQRWDPHSRLSLLFHSNELAGEVGEACNIVKKLERIRLGIRGSNVTLNMLAQELADVVICADLTAMRAGIDLGQALREKFNETSTKYKLNVFFPVNPEAPCGSKSKTRKSTKRSGSSKTSSLSSRSGSRKKKRR